MGERRVAVVIAGAAAVVTVAWFTGLPYAFTDPQRHIDVVAWAQAEEAAGVELLAGARDTTGDDCGTSLPCVQAVTAEHVAVYRFGTREEARAARDDLGRDAHLSGWIVVDHTDPEIPSDERRILAERIDGHHASD